MVLKIALNTKFEAYESGGISAPGLVPAFGPVAKFLFEGKVGQILAAKALSAAQGRKSEEILERAAEELKQMQQPILAMGDGLWPCEFNTQFTKSLLKDSRSRGCFYADGGFQQAVAILHRGK